MDFANVLITLSTPLNRLTSALFLATTSPHVLYAPPTCTMKFVAVPRVHTTFAYRGLSVAAAYQYGTHSLLAFALVLHHILSVVFLKLTVLTRPSVPPSGTGSHKCLRFGLWPTLCTLKDFIYLFIYLLTYLLTYLYLQ